MRNKVGTEDSPFPEEQVRYYNRIELSGHPLIFATAVDPSGTATSGSDFRSVVTFGFDQREMNFRCMHAWIKRRSISDMFTAAYIQNDLYPGSVCIEENMFKDFLHDAIFNFAREIGRFLPWQTMQHSTNKIGRIVGRCSYLWEHGKILFEKNQSDQRILIEQFVYIYNPTVNDDGPDAAEMAISHLQSGGGQGAIYETVRKRESFDGLARRGAW